MRCAGRPSKLSPEVRDAIVQAVLEGCYPEVAAAAVGIGRTTFYRWMQLGEASERGPYRDFWECIKQANAAAEKEVVSVIKGHMKKEWQAGMTYLERRFPDRWAKMQRIEHTGPNGKDLFDAEKFLSHPTLAPLRIEDRRRVAAGLHKLLPMLAAAAGEADEDEAVEAIEAEPEGEQSPDGTAT